MNRTLLTFAFSFSFVVTMGLSDLSPNDMKEIAAIIEASEGRMRASLEASEGRMRTSLQAVAVELSSLIRDETHLFVKKSVSKMSPCVMKLKNTVTVFGVLYEGVKYVITPGHFESEKLQHAYVDIGILNVSAYPDLKLTCFINVSEESVARASIGDNLFAIGRDETGANLHIWTGVVHSVFQEVFGKELDTEDVPVGSLIATYLKTSGGQVAGMSGAPVFNGCGLSGVGTGADLLFQNIGIGIATSFLGAHVVHVDHILELLRMDEAIHFSVQPHEALDATIVSIPMKTYCSSGVP